MSRCATVALPADPLWLSQRLVALAQGLRAGKAHTLWCDLGGTARTLKLCPAQPLGLAHSWVDLAVQLSLGEAENREGAGRWPAFLFYLVFERIQIKSLLTETFPLRTHLSPSGDPPGISDASSQPRSAYEITSICEPRDAKTGKHAY